MEPEVKGCDQNLSHTHDTQARRPCADFKSRISTSYAPFDRQCLSLDNEHGLSLSFIVNKEISIHQTLASRPRRLNSSPIYHLHTS